MCLSTQLHHFEGSVEAEELVKNLSTVKHFLSRDNERCSAQAGLRRKGPIIYLGIWTEQPNDEEDQMLSHQRSEPVCARAKRRPITKKVFTLLELLHPAVGPGGCTWILGSLRSPICQMVPLHTKPGPMHHPNLMTGP